MNSDNFEQRLRRQSARKIPAEWREEILSAANSAHRPLAAPKRSEGGSPIFHLLSSIFWPNPRAWAGLAAVWVLIFTLKLSTHDTSHVIAGKFAKPSPQVIEEVRQQKRFFGELAGLRETPDAEPPKLLLLRPRSERRSDFDLGLV